MGGCLYYLNSIVIIDSWYEVGGAGLIGIGIYVGFLALLREFTKDDLKLFLDILNPKGMKDYVVSEIKDKNNADEGGLEEGKDKDSPGEQ
jgi:hypothetical protein